MYFSPSCLLLFLLLIHGLALQTSYASRKLIPIMAEARGIHDMGTMESESLKLFAQMKVDFRKKKGKPIRGKPSSPMPNRPVHMFLPPVPPPRVLLRRPPPPPCHS